MEQWQFLIQKQGERAWQPLESPYAEIVEGRYRIVASSLRPNTEVEVRVIHQSPSEIPPRRRIHKRLRRTNSEGLTAVIPFTYFTPGVWEVRCNGDLMSDILGTSWQHNLRLQVLPLVATTEITAAKNDAEGHLVSSLPIPPAPPNFKELVTDEFKLDDISLDEFTELVTAAEAELKDENSITTPENYQDIPQLNEQIANQTSEDTDDIAYNQVEQLQISNHELESSTSCTQDVIDTAPLSAENISTDSTHTIIDEPISLSINSLALRIRPSVVEAIVDQPVNPVWVKGDSAEQILQNLIELALPGADSLLEEEAATEQLEQPLPLLLILDQQSYVAQWGRTCTIRGQVKLRAEAPTHKDDISEFESVGAGELRVELCSPLGLEVLVQQQQSLGERLLPFSFEFSIDIPANCDSKLILADIYLYGALSSLGDSILLASQSFTITADVTELLAISATAKPSEPDMLDVAQPQLTPEPEKSVSLNLELFNLAKTARKPTSPLVTKPSPKRALPLRVDEPRQPKQTPQLSGSGSTIKLASSVSNSTSLPFLRKRQPAHEQETASNTLVESQQHLELENLGLENLELENFGLDNLGLETTNTQVYIDDVTAEASDMAPDDTQFSKKPVPRAIPLGLRTTEIRQSPLIQKWMQSQGYSISETINLQRASYDTNMVPGGVPNINIVNSSIDYSTENSTANPTENITIDTTINENASDESNNNQGAEETESVTLEPELATQLTTSNIQDTPTPSTWQTAEIVIDDIDESIDSTDSESYEVPTPEETVANMLSSLPFSLEDIELLPVPQINLPPRELVSGNTIRVKIVLPEMRPNTGVKLWVEDCQTRWLLEGPHLLTDFLPNLSGEGMESITQLNIPFGCVEIRIEAVSVDIITQSESDKASVSRTVVPPDLPTLQFDELLGI